MNLDWQNDAALALVATAAIYLARLAWRTLGRRATSCGGCGTCPASIAGTPSQIVGVDQLAQSASATVLVRHADSLSDAQPAKAGP